MNIGMNTELEVILTPKHNNPVQNRNLSLPIHLKEDLIDEITLMHNYGIIAVLPFYKCASPIFIQRKSSGKLCPLVDLRKINILNADDYTNNNNPVNTLSDAAQHLAGKSFFCKLDCSQSITAYRWRTNGHKKCLHLILLAEPLPTKDLHKVSADLCLPFQASCASTWTQLLKQTNVLNTWTILESQPTMLRTLTGTFGQSSSAFAMQDWNWQLESATLESGKLNFLQEQFHPREYRHKLKKFEIF